MGSSEMRHLQTVGERLLAPAAAAATNSGELACCQCQCVWIRWERQDDQMPNVAGFRRSDGVLVAAAPSRVMPAMFRVQPASAQQVMSPPRQHRIPRAVHLHNFFNQAYGAAAARLQGHRS